MQRYADVGSAKTVSQQRKPKEEILFKVFDNGTIVETLYQASENEPLKFAVCEKGGSPEICDAITVEGTDYVPMERLLRFVATGKIKLASGLIAYDSPLKLLENLKGFLSCYVELSSYDLSLMAHYGMMTWVYDAFDAFPYLRFKGEPATGKTRCLDVMNHLCCRSVAIGGSASKSAMFRQVDQTRGTLILDEADFDGGLRSDYIKLLNEGYKKNGVTTLSKLNDDDWIPEVYNIGCPKILANRLEFSDRALETRCLTIQTVLRPVIGVPANLPPGFTTEAQILRNQLLKYRLDTLHNVKREESNLSGLEGRPRELALPIYSISPDVEFQLTFLRRLMRRSRALREVEPLKIVLEAINTLWVCAESSKIMLSRIGLVAKNIALERGASEWEFHPKRIADHVRSLGFVSTRIGPGMIVRINKDKLIELNKMLRPTNAAV